MALSIGTVRRATTGGSGGTLSNFTVNAGEFLIAVAQWRSTSASSMVDIVWNSNETLTRFATKVQGTSNQELWYLASPTASVASVVFIPSGNIMTSGTLSCRTASGVSTNDPWGSVVSGGAASGTSLSAIVSTAANEIVLDWHMVTQSSSTATAGSSQVTDYFGLAGGGTNYWIGASTQLATGSATTMNWSWQTSNTNNILAAALKPMTATAVPIRNNKLYSESKFLVGKVG